MTLLVVEDESFVWLALAYCPPAQLVCVHLGNSAVMEANATDDAADRTAENVEAQACILPGSPCAHYTDQD